MEICPLPHLIVFNVRFFLCLIAAFVCCFDFYFIIDICIVFGYRFCLFCLCSWRHNFLIHSLCSSFILFISNWDVAVLRCTC